MFSTCFSRCQFDLNQSSQLPIFFNLYPSPIPSPVPTPVPTPVPIPHPLPLISFPNSIVITIKFAPIYGFAPIPLETPRPDQKSCFSCRFYCVLHWSGSGCAWSYAQFVLRIRLPVNHAPTTFRPALDRSSMSNCFSKISDSLQKISRYIGICLSDFL